LVFLVGNHAHHLPSLPEINQTTSAPGTVFLLAFRISRPFVLGINTFGVFAAAHRNDAPKNNRPFLRPRLVDPPAVSSEFWPMRLYVDDRWQHWEKSRSSSLKKQDFPDIVTRIHPSILTVRFGYTNQL